MTARLADALPPRDGLCGTQLNRANFLIELCNPRDVVQAILLERASLQIVGDRSEVLRLNHCGVTDLAPFLVPQDAAERDPGEWLCQMLVELIPQSEHLLLGVRLQKADEQEEHALVLR